MVSVEPREDQSPAPSPQLLGDLLLALDWGPLLSNRLCSSLVMQSDPRQCSSASLLSPFCLKHITRSSCLHRDTRHKAKYFCLPWFSSIVFININLRCQRPLRLEACRLPGEESTLGMGPSAHLHYSSPSLPGCHHPSMHDFLG